ncbi:MAG: SRPBCC domain-containing protein, partial [Vicinamibacterales bacterium]
MVLGSTVNSDSFKVSTPSDREIRMTRLFNAPRALVFEAMTKPEHVKQWWGRLGEGYSVPLCEIDLRPGGRWRFVNKHPHGEAAYHGEYREIAPPGRLVFTEIFEEFPDSVSVVTAEFTEEGGKTR